MGRYDYFEQLVRYLVRKFQKIREKVIQDIDMWVNIWEWMLGIKIFIRRINVYQRVFFMEDMLNN